MRRIISLIATVLAVCLVVLGLACGDNPPNGPDKKIPEISSFIAQPQDIDPGSQTTLSWRTLRTDSLWLLPLDTILLPGENDSGSIAVNLEYPTTYSLVAYNTYGVDSASVSVTMFSAAAEIIDVAFFPLRVVADQTSTLSWKTIRADSLVIDQGVGRVDDPDLGNVIISPVQGAWYRVIAYSVYGNDTAMIWLTLSSRSAIEPLNGLYFKGIMEDSTTHLPMQFAVVDDSGHYLINQQIQLSLVAGDGSLDPRSILTDSTGVTEFTYGFTGNYNRALIRLNITGIPSVYADIRTDALVPGAYGQTQYILFDDTYEQVVAFNGQPASVDTYEGHSIMYVNYESTLGVVVMLYDRDQDRQLYDTSSVYGVIVNTSYQGQTNTTPPIGVGSSLADLRAVWGDPSRLYYEEPRPAIVIGYDSIFTTFYGHWEIGMTDTLVEEIHFIEPLIVK
ncbi:MAG: hypothetical protein KOO62_01740 [candidate division Zixibacteria bacterium]|nr:hypothetical protein [candidate division Zixibacteria bacterium]